MVPGLVCIAVAGSSTGPNTGKTDRYVHEEIMLLRLEQTERRYNSPLLPRSTNVVLIAGIYVRKVIQLRFE